MASVAKSYKELDTDSTNVSSDAYRAPVVLMVSGGADSTALFSMALEEKVDIQDGLGPTYINKSRLFVIHVNHQLRGNDAVRDEKYVISLCEKHDIPYKIVRADVAGLARSEGDGNVENMGRVIRYGEANKLADELSDEWGVDRKYARILSAHSASDRAETFMMNAIRGTGVSGLSSIPQIRGRVVRPLFNYSHDELKKYLIDRGIPWVEDETNKDTHYLRSFVRYEVLPVLKKKNPRVVESLASTAQLLSDEDAFMERHAASEFDRIVTVKSSNLLALDINELALLDVAVARRVVRYAILQLNAEARIESQHIEQALVIVANKHGSAQICEGIDVRCAQGLLYFNIPDKNQTVNTGYLSVPGKFNLGGNKFVEASLLEVGEGQNPVDLAREFAQKTKSQVVLLDWGKVGATGGKLWIGPLNTGDTMCPLGMNGKSKKLVDVLREGGVPASQKLSIPVIRTSNREQVVLLGSIRADERFRCEKTSSVLIQLKFINLI